MVSFSSYFQIILPRPLRASFTYGWNPVEGAREPEVGSLVRVPFGRTNLSGIVVQKVEQPTDFDPSKIKAISSVEIQTPVLSSELLKLTQWMSRYYLCSWGEAAFNALPKFSKKFMKDEGFETKMSDFYSDSFSRELTVEQSKALGEIQTGFRESKPMLLHGVTGSGKTEVYLRLAAEVLQQGKSVIYLVPEITLISQIRLFCEETFPGQVTLIHSKQTSKERLRAWQSLRTGERRFVLGPRSALFAPVKDLGLIIIDEEHDASYKQSETPRYNTFQTAWERTRIESSSLLLGSATPSLNSNELVKEGLLGCAHLTRRIGTANRAQVSLVDLRRRKAGQPITDDLKNKIDERLQKKEGILIFLNRTGYSTQIKCGKCGYFFTCPHCDVGLTYHQKVSKLICHYCRYAVKPEMNCPECKNVLQFKGVGTEKIESELARLFPTARIERIDREIVGKQESLDEIFHRFRNKETDILVGTQMLTKGLDFKHLTLVGVLQADSHLQLPDFKAAERTYQVLEQVAGRAGRGEHEGEVILQTYSPDHYSIQAVLQKNYERYTEEELNHRRKYQYPPFTKMINFTLRGRDEAGVTQAAENFRDDVEEIVKRVGDEIEILGPAPLPFYRLRGYYRWHVMVKSPRIESFKLELDSYLSKRRQTPGTYLEVDVDPEQIL